MTVDLRALRYRHGMTQAELARAIGVGRTRVIELENRPFNVPLVVRLAISALVAGLEPYETDPEDIEALEEAGALRIGDRRTEAFNQAVGLPRPDEQGPGARGCDGQGTSYGHIHDQRRRRGLQ